ncbi:protein giant-lens [Trichogramma pretiosum]|uniref:protein giant-lens n=1 Tax=Trichogramma pretiosum TaxID=7493 RepID=UPI0006C95F39|nr:protein giant-lens [Trichogramma pretiosum]
MQLTTQTLFAALFILWRCSPTAEAVLSPESLLGLSFDDETGEELFRHLEAYSSSSTTTTTTTTPASIGISNQHRRHRNRQQHLRDNNELIHDDDYGNRNRIQHRQKDTTIVLIEDEAAGNVHGPVSSGLSNSHHHNNNNNRRHSTNKRRFNKDPVILYQIGSSEEDLPECSEKNEVCSKVDLYGDPWIEKQCRCQQGSQCSSSLHADDGHTVVDKTRQYKLCEPVKRLPICRYFKDVTWTIAPGSDPNNSTIQKVNCRCRPGSVAYLLKRQFYMKDNGQPGFIYSFACSPQSRMRCQAKEPCRLFTVHKKTSTAQALAQGLEDVNASPLCMCQKGYRCPKRHTDLGSLPSPYYGEGMGVKVFSGHCVPQRHPPEPVYTLV